MEIQKAHLEHLNAMAEAKQVCIAGPLEGGGKNRGIVVFRTKSLEEAEAQMAEDPAVKAGRLAYEIYPWWAAQGSKLF